LSIWYKSGGGGLGLKFGLCTEVLDYWAFIRYGAPTGGDTADVTVLTSPNLPLASHPVLMNKPQRQLYPTQAKRRLEWATQMWWLEEILSLKPCSFLPELAVSKSPAGDDKSVTRQLRLHGRLKLISTHVSVSGPKKVR